MNFTYEPDNDIFGYPQEYKGIKFYPVKVKETKLKERLYTFFFQPKNYIPDKDILKMSYLKFLLFVIGGGKKADKPDYDIEKELIDFLYEVTKIDIPKEDEPKKIYLDIKSLNNNAVSLEDFFICLYIDGIKIDEQDFENIREILVRQNGSSLEWIEGYIPDLEKKMAFLNHDSLDTTFEDEMFTFCALTGDSELEAGEKTLYQFRNRFERETLLKTYELFKPLEVSGQISAKNKKQELFKHYMSHIDRNNRYASLLVEESTFLEDSGLGNPNNGIKTN